MPTLIGGAIHAFHADYTEAAREQNGHAEG